MERARLIRCVHWGERVPAIAGCSAQTRRRSVAAFASRGGSCCARRLWPDVDSWLGTTLPTPSDKPPSTGMRTGTHKGRRCCHRSRFNPAPPSFEAAFAQRIYRSTDPSVSASMSRLDKQAAGMAVRSKAISSAGSLHCRPTLRQAHPPGSRLHRSPEDSSALATCPRRSRLER